MDGQLIHINAKNITPELINALQTLVNVAVAAHEKGLLPNEAEKPIQFITDEELLAEGFIKKEGTNVYYKGDDFALFFWGKELNRARITKYETASRKQLAELRNDGIRTLSNLIPIAQADIENIEQLRNLTTK